MKALVDALRHLGLVLVDPVSAQRRAVERPSPLAITLILVVALTSLGAATLPRQIAVLDAAFAPTGDQLADLQAAMMRPGLLRVMVADRLVPLPAVLVAGLLVVFAAKPLLALPHSQGRAVWTVALLGLAPLVVQRVGELAITYVFPIPVDPPAGMAVTLPHRFSTGPSLLWAGDAPAWVQLLDPRANLVALWTLALWGVGLRTLDGRPRFESWHLLVPALCLVGGGLTTWVLGPLVVTAILGGP